MGQQFSNEVACLDLEVTRAGRLHRIGAFLPASQATFERKERFDVADSLTALDEFCGGASWLLGHNLLRHDLKVLVRLAPDLKLLRLPIIDTLFLSPLAFPENPYHHLVKDYRLVRDAVSDPVADCRLAWQVFEDQCAAFGRLGEIDSRMLRFFAHCFSDFEEDSGGLASVFEALANEPSLPAAEVAGFVAEQCRPRACAWAVEQLHDELQCGAPPALAYAIAWLRVAGGSSVLPPWVRVHFPELPRLLDRLRQPLGKLCGQRDDCGYCQHGLGPRAELQRIFGFDDFRPEPQAADGSSLQQAIVDCGLAGQPHLAVLATGAGKSICYQLPALVHFFRRGQMTIVISPLQALMKDQVENLNQRTGGEYAAALYGLLTPPERGQVLERIRLGSIALLYVAPEQLRNRSFEKIISQREIAAWVYDEAHCLSKWGHDFRPDYLYAARFIRSLAARQKRRPPPVSCFTATAKQQVVEEILAHFKENLEHSLTFFGSSVDRDELTFLVEAVAPQEKLPRIVQLLREHVSSGASSGGSSGGSSDGRGGCAVVYFASRKATVRAAAVLAEQQVDAAAFHAGLDAAEKRRVLEAFTGGELRVVCATNAFGMGIDKEDVRLVIHADIPGSLENYLQEAGRAGRDRRSSLCVLFYDEDDVERQFKMVAGSRLSQRDIAQLLGGIRRVARRQPATKSKAQEVVLTSGELVRDEEVDIALKPDDWGVDTRVKSAVAWLERAGFLRRLHNRTRVFQGRLRIDDLSQANTLIDALPADQRPTPAERQRWLVMLGALINAEPSRGLTADELAELPGMSWREEQQQAAGQHVLRGLAAMADAGLLTAGLQLAAFVRPKGKGNARVGLEKVARLERAMLEELQAADPDAERGEWRELSLRLLNQKLLDRGLDSHPQRVRRLLRSLVEDGKGLAGRQGSLELRYRSRDRYQMCLLREWPALRDLADRRQQVAQVVLDTFLSRADPAGKGLLLIELAMDDLVSALRNDLVLRQMLRDPLAAAERGLLFLHEQDVLQLQHGLAVFRQAMTLEVASEAKRRRYSKRDYDPLEVHYGERTFQVHAMARYAELGLEKLHEALHLVRDYFAASRGRFAATWFPDAAEETARATSAESFRRIVDDLGNAHQIALVTAPVEQNLLVLAGPGAGKTRVVVHRCAYLLRVERVPARSMLVLCFNRNASLELRRRLRDLVGDDARGVTVCTYHGLAMRLVGRSFATVAAVDQADLSKVIPEAVELLRGDEADVASSADDLRSDALAGYSHILVDEYQDIDQDQYELVAEVAGRSRQEGKLAILAVGDDDQTIYGWSGARVEFIRQFREDYDAEEHYLVQCYRSSRYILEAAHGVVRGLPDRLKVDHPIQVNEARQQEPPGGSWATLDPAGQGRVRLIEPRNGLNQAKHILGWLSELKRLDPDLQWRDCAVLARRRDVLMPIRAALEERLVPVTWVADRDRLPPLHRIRELRQMLDWLRAQRHHSVRATELLQHAESAAGSAGPWHELLLKVLEEWTEEAGDRPAEARAVAEFLYESLAERRRTPAAGGGVLLSTVHAAKGLEFAHVAVVDGGWGQKGTSARNEEERRLFYVAMTRAKQTLLLSSLAGQSPLVRHLEGAALDRRPLAVSEVANLDAAKLQRKFEVLGLKDLFLSYAGQAPSAAPLHGHLETLETGDRVELRAEGRRVAVLDSQGHRVAELSGEGGRRVLPRLHQVHQVRVLAMVERRREDSEPAYHSNLAVERWEVPVLEVVWRR